jgi:hypothetical protein
MCMLLCVIKEIRISFNIIYYVVLQGQFNSDSGQNAHGQGASEGLSFTVIGDL